MEQSQKQYQGPERRRSKERRRLDWPFPGMSTQDRKEEQAERAREQQKEQDEHL